MACQAIGQLCISVLHVCSEAFTDEAGTCLQAQKLVNDMSILLSSRLWALAKNTTMGADLQPAIAVAADNPSAMCCGNR